MNIAGRKVLMLVWTSVATDTRVLREATTLVEDGWSVHIIGRAVPPDYVPPAGVTVSSAGSPPLSAGRTRSLSAPERAVRWALLPSHIRRRMQAWQAGALDIARQWAAEHGPAEVVHAHDLSALPVGARLADEWGARLVYDSHEYWTGRPREHRPAPWLRRSDRRLEARLGARADAVITVGDGVAGLLQRDYGWTHVQVVRNTFPLLGPSADPDAHVDADLTAPTALLYAGRLAAFRELETIARASHDIDLPIELMGPADDAWLKDFDPGRATVLPPCPVDVVDRCLARAGVAVVTHSDKWENHRMALPNKLFHAVRVGVPVIAADVGELARTVREYGVGVTYRPGDAADFVRATKDVVADYAALRAAVRAAAEPLSWSPDAAVLRHVYRELTSERTR